MATVIVQSLDRIWRRGRHDAGFQVEWSKIFDAPTITAAMSKARKWIERNVMPSDIGRESIREASTDLVYLELFPKDKSEAEELHSTSEFLVMGTCVSFRYEPEGEKRAREIDAPLKYGLIHCASGSAWPRCVLMVGPWTRGKAVEDNEISLAARKFLRTDDYEPHEGQFQAPSLNSNSWKLLGELRKIWYLRQGALDFYLKHDFKRRQFLIFPAKTLLFRSSRWWKVKMPGTCVINDRGIVNP